jgi:predicted transcriptional regulator
MLSEKEDARLRVRLEKQLHAVASKLLDVKGQSIRETVRILTPEQRQLIKAEMKKPDAPADLSELIGRIFNNPEK